MECGNGQRRTAAKYIASSFTTLPPALPGSLEVHPDQQMTPSFFPPIALCNSLKSEEHGRYWGLLASLLGAWTLLGAPGRTTRNKKLLGAHCATFHPNSATHASGLIVGGCGGLAWRLPDKSPRMSGLMSEGGTLRLQSMSSNKFCAAFPPFSTRGSGFGE